MRFAWLRTKERRDEPVATSIERLTRIAYNVAWWVPVVMPILGVMSYRFGFVAFLAVTVARALVNGSSLTQSDLIDVFDHKTTIHFAASMASSITRSNV